MREWEKLSFEERQREWQGKERQFRQHQGRNERPTVWTIRVEGDRVFTSHGLLDGAKQVTDKQGKAKNVGRSNAISPEQDALAQARRLCRKKWDFEGFDEYVGDMNIDRRNVDVTIPNLLTNLPGSFCLYKPDNSITSKALIQKINFGQVLYTLKRNGLAFLVVVDYYGNIVFYSRRGRPTHDKEGPTEKADGTLDYNEAVPWTARFPHLVEAIRGLNLPPCSMLACELIAQADVDDFKYVSSITKSLTPESLKEQKEKGLPFFYIWDIPFLGGDPIIEHTKTTDRYSLIYSILYSSTSAKSINFLKPIYFEQFDSTQKAIDSAKANGYEGWVVVDPDGVYGDRGWNLKGKPDRPSMYCAKLKPTYEDDFIAYWDPDSGQGKWGEGKHEKGKRVTLPDGSEAIHGGVGCMALYQLNKKGDLVYICDCGSGMTYEIQAGLRKESFPVVVQVEYTDRTYVSDGEDTNALLFPTFLQVHEDKDISECVNARL
jgi:hypothetical protein